MKMGCSHSKATSGNVKSSAANANAASSSSGQTPVRESAATVKAANVTSNARPTREDATSKATSTKTDPASPRSRSTTPTPSLDGSVHSSASSMGSSRRRNAANGLMRGSESALGLDKMIDDRRDAKTMSERIVHIEVPFGKPIEEVYNGVHDGPVLGSGISGLVRLATHKATGLKYAVKCLDLSLVDTEEGLQQLREEIYIMCQLDHPNIVRLEEVYESHSEIYLVQELCLGGELFDRLDEQPDYHYTEAQCARLVKQMLCSVRYIHSKGIIHRDLKLENFLFSDTGADSELKMIDFGLSKHFKFGEVQHEAVGTPYTVAPEVIRGSYDERCDVWAIGVITYLLLSGESPFGGCGGPEPLMQVRDNILKGSFVFEPEDVWQNVSSEAKAFIRKLLVTDPNMRPTAREVQKDPWLLQANRSNRSDDKQLNPSVVKALVNFKEYSDMRKLLCEVLSFTLIPDQIQGLRSEFEKFDTDGSGEITLSALKSVLIGNAAQGSLGALTEEEVEDIFNAMRVSKSETTIHWHEFIAAGLSHCKVDERNLKLAFDRLDADHTGYITFENFMDLIGNGAVHSEEALREMWGEAATHSDEAWLSYEDFLLLMKGQPTPGQLRKPTICPAKQPSAKSGMSLAPVMESVSTDSAYHENEASLLRTSMNSSQSAAALAGFMSPSFGEEEPNEFEGPISMDGNADDTLNEGFLEALRHQGKGFSVKDSLTTPDSPNSLKSRSKSFDEPAAPQPFVKGNALRAINLPEHQPGSTRLNINDKSKTTLAVNRELYRAHRQMRLAVLEASKRLEEEHQRRAREEMRKEQARSNKGGAGLIMRHGGELSADAIKQFVVQRQKEEQKKIDQAVSKGGRRHNRNKTASDIRGMFGGSGSELNNQLTLPPQRKTSGHRAGAIPDFANPPLTGPIPEKPTVTGDLPELPQMREATKPGQFRKTNYDPFSFGTMKSGGAANEGPTTMDSSVHRHIENSLRDVLNDSLSKNKLKSSGSLTNLDRSSHSNS
ncbi:hypothetical protein ACHAW6_009897 [Cyclotella cf. meneghiniana]